MILQSVWHQIDIKFMSLGGLTRDASEIRTLQNLIVNAIKRTLSNKTESVLFLLLWLKTKSKNNITVLAILTLELDRSPHKALWRLTRNS